MANRVLIACSNYYPHSFGGTEVYVESYAEFLREKNNIVFIITATPAKYFTKENTIYVDNILKVCKYLYKETVVFGVNYQCNVDTELIYSKYRQAHAASWENIISQHPELSNLDILHIQSFTATIGLNLFKSVIKYNTSIKVIASYHTPISCPKGTLMYANTLKECQIKADAAACASCRLSEVLNIPFKITEYIDTFISVFNFQQGSALLRNRKLAALDIDAFKQLDALTDEWWVHSEGIKENLLRNGVICNKIKASRHGISEVFLSAKKVKKGSEEIVFLYSGRLAKIKGFHTLIKAWLGLPVISERKLLITASPYSDDRSIQKLILKAIKRKDINFIGSLNQAELASVYREANCVIIPSECYEIGPMVFHEAIASDCNVICSDIGGCKELATYYSEGAVTFKAGCADSLRSKIISAKDFISPDKKLIHSIKDHFQLISR